MRCLRQAVASRGPHVRRPGGQAEALCRRPPRKERVLQVHGRNHFARPTSAAPATAGPWFEGLIDDVRLFDRGLTADEVWALSQQPVFHMDFEKTSGWEDVSPLPCRRLVSTAVTPRCTTQAGIQGSAAKLQRDELPERLEQPASTRSSISAAASTRSRPGSTSESGCGLTRSRCAIQSIVGSDADEQQAISRPATSRRPRTDSNWPRSGQALVRGASYRYCRWSESNYTCRFHGAVDTRGHDL